MNLLNYPGAGGLFSSHVNELRVLHDWMPVPDAPDERVPSAR